MEKIINNNNNENSLTNDTHKNAPLPFSLISLQKFVLLWFWSFLVIRFWYLLLQCFDVNLRRELTEKLEENLLLWLLLLDDSVDRVTRFKRYVF